MTGTSLAEQYYERICPCPVESEQQPGYTCEPCVGLDARTAQRRDVVRRLASRGVCYEDIWGYLLESADNDPVSQGDFDFIPVDDFELVRLGVDVPGLESWEAVR